MKQWPGGSRAFVVEVVGDSKTRRIDFKGERVEAGL
jgi:hypothetical protein